MKIGCYTKLLFTIIFVIGVGYYVINKYVIKDFSNNIKEKLITEFIESNFESNYKDSIANFIDTKIDENKIDFSFLKDYALKIKDFQKLDEKEKFLQLKKLLEKDGTQN